MNDFVDAFHSPGPVDPVGQRDEDAGSARGAVVGAVTGFSGVAGVRDGTPVVGAICVALTAGDWVWTASPATPNQTFTPLCAVQAAVRRASLE